MAIPVAGLLAWLRAQDEPSTNRHESRTFELPTCFGHIDRRREWTLVLSFDAGRFATALGRARFVDATDGVGMSVFGGHDMLAAISQLVLIPDNGFEEALQRARGDILVQSNGFGIFTLHIGEQSANVNHRQRSSSRTGKTTRELLQKLTEQFTQLCDIFD